MPIRIGHASTSNPSSGLSADEVKISTYYASLAPTVVLRPNTSSLAEKSAQACEAGCNNDKIEYSQSSRNTLQNRAEALAYDLSAITTTCYADCSSFMTVCAIAGGAKFKYGYSGSSNAPTTRNMRSWFTSSGDYTALTNHIYLASPDYLKRGDILVNEGSHTVMVLDDGNKAPSTDSVAVDDNQINQIANSLAYRLSIDIDKVTSTEAFIIAKIVKIEAGIEKLLTNTEITDLYKWSYSYGLASGAAHTIMSKKEKVSHNPIKFSLSNLKANSAYSLSVSVSAIDGKNNFSSPIITFSTPTEKQVSVKSLVLENDKNQLKNSVDKIYLNINNDFKRTLIYKIGDM